MFVLLQAEASVPLVAAAFSQSSEMVSFSEARQALLVFKNEDFAYLAGPGMMSLLAVLPVHGLILHVGSVKCAVLRSM